MNAQNARDLVARDSAKERENLANRSAHAQSLPLGGTPTLLQLSALDGIANAALAEFQRRGAEIGNHNEVAATGRLLLLGGTFRSGNVATSLYFEVEVTRAYGVTSDLHQFWIDATGHYAFESPDAYLYEDPTTDDLDEE